MKQRSTLEVWSGQFMSVLTRFCRWELKDHAARALPCLGRFEGSDNCLVKENGMLAKESSACLIVNSKQSDFLPRQKHP